MKITDNIPDVLADLARLKEQLQSDMRQSTSEVAVQAKQLAILGTNTGVYFTAPGRYSRTGELLARIDAQPVPQSAGVFGVIVLNDSDHASEVEYGTHGNDLNEYSAAQLSDALGDKFTPLYLGRSGRNWVAPNPACTRGAVYAGYALADAFQKHLTKRFDEMEVKK